MTTVDDKKTPFQKTWDCFNSAHIVWSDDGARARWKDCLVVARLLGEKAMQSWMRIVDTVLSFDGTFFGTPGYRLVISCDCELSFYFEYQYKVDKSLSEVERQSWKCRMNGGFIFHQRAKEWSSHT